MTLVPLHRLRNECAWLDQELAQARRAPQLDLDLVSRLRGRKLALKARIAALEAQRPHPSAIRPSAGRTPSALPL